MNTEQPPIQRAIDALHAAARLDSPPADAADLEARLADLHNPTGPCLLDALSDLIKNLAETAGATPGLDAEQRDLIATWLSRAVERLGFVRESIDHARAATGTWTA